MIFSRSFLFYLIMSIFSPTVNVAFIFIGGTLPTGELMSHLFPSKITSEVFPFSTALTVLSVMMLVYFIAFIYSD
jgi:hypothetical protein